MKGEEERGWIQHKEGIHQRNHLKNCFLQNRLDFLTQVTDKILDFWTWLVPYRQSYETPH